MNRLMRYERMIAAEAAAADNACWPEDPLQAAVMALRKQLEGRCPRCGVASDVFCRPLLPAGERGAR
jgi:hypothetical protein